MSGGADVVSLVGINPASIVVHWDSSGEVGGVKDGAGSSVCAGWLSRTCHLDMVGITSEEDAMDGWKCELGVREAN